jgi:hypothetical protein
MGSGELNRGRRYAVMWMSPQMFGLRSTLKFTEMLKACQLPREDPVPCDGISFLWQVSYLYLKLINLFILLEFIVI